MHLEGYDKPLAVFFLLVCSVSGKLRGLPESNLESFSAMENTRH